MNFGVYSNRRRRPPVVPSVALADLTATWTVVAVSRKPGQWDWLLPPREVDVFMLAREDGGILSGQAKIADGVYELKAKLPRYGARG